MALKVKKLELTGQVMPWKCDLCGEPFEPDLKAICTQCGRLCCPAHREASPAGAGSPGSRCTDCAAAEKAGGP